jgi:hypothetical protein
MPRWAFWLIVVGVLLVLAAPKVAAGLAKTSTSNVGTFVTEVSK